MKTNRHRTSWLAGLLGLAVLLCVNQAVQAQAVRGLANVAGKWGSGTPMLAAGVNYTCALTGDGLVRCWGFNGQGRLGDGTTAPRSTPVVSRLLTDANGIAAGFNHTCAVRANGQVMCWGANSDRQLGDGTTEPRLSPVTVSGITNAVAVTVGDSHSCAVLATGIIQCWGSNSIGRLGDGTREPRFSPVTVSGITNAVAVAAGDAHSCALLATGTIRCWGFNLSGQLGNGDTGEQLRPVTVSGITNAIAITAGANHNCALLANGSVMCWGFNSDGQTGSQAILGTPAPVGIANAVAVTAGRNHTCALLATGNMQCWGRNAEGQLGNGSNSPAQPNPVTVSGLSQVVAIAAGNDHTCAFITPARTRCWGSNRFGQLGDGTSTPSNLPVTATLTRSISASEVVSGGRHSCAVRVDGTVACWGANDSGQIGNGSTFPQPAPGPVSGLNTALSVALGADHSCALRADGRVACWGKNTAMQLGSPVTPEGRQIRPTLVQIDRLGQPLSEVKQVAAGLNHTCALMAAGDIRCWGHNGAGQLGDGSRIDKPFPVPVVGITDAVELRVGAGHSCARLASGTIRCWGQNNSGQVGDSSSNSSYDTPVPVTGLTDAVALAAGHSHTCALRADGVVRCWGHNGSGQLGDGTELRSPFPVPVSGLAGVTAITAGTVHTCAVTANGGAFCWGDNTSGQFGAGSSLVKSPRPIAVTKTTRNWSVAGISGGGEHTCALSAGDVSKGAPLCWGKNANGQVGVVDTATQFLAVEVPSFRFNIDPAVVLRSSPRSASVTALIDCPAKEVVRIQATLRQDGVEGTAVSTKACKGYLHRYPLKVTARNKDRFSEGSGVVEASGIVKNRGQVSDTQSWTRNVEVLSQVPAP